VVPPSEAQEKEETTGGDVGDGKEPCEELEKALTPALARWRLRGGTVGRG
jgi:hypothetical protein